MRLSVAMKILGIGLILPVAFAVLALMVFLQMRQAATFTAAEAAASDQLAAVANTRGGFLQVRVLEKAFLNDPADALVTRHAAQMTQAKAALEKLGTTLTSAEDKAADAALKKHVADYDRAFAELLAAYRTMGFNERTGLQGTLRASVQELETQMKDRADASYQAAILTLRRREKDFQLRVEDRYRQTLNTESAALKARMTENNLGEYVPLLDIYNRDFNAYADIRLKVDETARRADAAGNAMLPVLNQLFEANQKALVSARAAADVVRRESLLMIFGFMVAVGVIGFVLAFFIGRGISGPLGNMIGIMKKLSDGDFKVAVPQLRRSDEIADMATALGVFRQNAEERQRFEAAERERIETERRAEAAQREKDARVAAEIAAFCSAVLQGDLGRRLSEADKDGVLLELSRQLNTLAGTLGNMTGEIATVAGAMADGRLTLSVSGDYHGVFGELKSSINGMSDKLRDFAGRLGTTADAVSSASAEISTGSQDLAQRTESQAASIEETAASMHEITTTVKQNADNAQMANQLSAAARDTATTGGTVVQDAVAAVTRIEESARKIADIVSLIDEIAFQTNLLALNASVEAARAGEAGKGFAVVAQEVRGLAQRSANASKDIKALIAESNSQVKTGAALVNQAGGSLNEIVASIKKVADIVGEIAVASREQATGLDQINTAVGSMDEMTQRNAALVEQTTAAAQSLSQQAGALATMVGFFKT